MSDLTTLNENQKAAVEWGEGSLLVLAGPGSGKTKVLTLRVARLIQSTSKENFRILGLTFTSKAATEMRERIQKQLGLDKAIRANLCTFHSFCTEVLRQYGNAIGLKPDFLILTEKVDREQYFLDTIRSVRVDENEIGDEDIRFIDPIDRLLSNCVQDEDIPKWISRVDVQQKVKKLYRGYRNLLIKENRVDFSTIIFFTEMLLRTKPHIKKQIQTVYPYICVDEFQDTNLSQYCVLKHLVDEKAPNLFVVADDDQVIYQWNGASPERLSQIRNDFKMSVIQLPANYRCPSPVIDLANNLIRNNIARAQDKKPLVAMKENPKSNAVRLQSFDSPEEELSWIEADIRSRGATNYSKCAILARTTKLLESVAEHLNANKIPTHIHVRKSDFISPPFLFLYALLRLTNSRADKEQLRKLTKGFFKLDGTDVPVDRVISESAATNGDLLRAWFEVTLKEPSIEASTQKFLTAIRKEIADKSNFLLGIDKTIEWCDAIQAQFGAAKEDVFSSYGEEKETWNSLQTEITDRIGSEDLTLHSFLQELDLMPKTAPAPPNSVRCFTIHSSKGMEFDHVYLIGMVEDQIPSFQSIKKGENSIEMQEERRNCFVAITRTQETLTMTYSKKYFGYLKQASRFLKEMGLVK